MDITVLVTTALIGVGFLFCGYLLGYSRAMGKMSGMIQTFINTMAAEGIIDKVKIRAYYKRNFNIDLDFKEIE